MAKMNIKYKDRLFRLLFGEEEYKGNILSLYNALNGTDFQDPDDISIYTIDDVIYIKMKNDVALIFDSYLTLWEQQSTLNNNMPVRGLMYFGKLYDKYITERELNIYGQTLVKLPTPQYIIFYNGAKDAPAVTKLRLSDAFQKPAEPGAFEWTATMYNLNPGKNEALLEKCRPLWEYMQLVNKIRENQVAEMDAAQAVDEAVTFCIDHDILKELLVKHRAEVVDMCITEYNEKVFVSGIRAEGLAEGRVQGREEGRVQGRSEGQNELVQAIRRIQKGATAEELRQEGFAPDTIDLAEGFR